jgi:serine/threonine-protein kinase
MTLEPEYVLKDRYIIQKPIGKGGMGSIYLALDNRLRGRHCAIKEVKQEEGLPEPLIQQSRDQFYREASVLAQLDHPTLPKVSDYFAEGNLDYLVMDFVPGEDLKTLMDKARRRNKFLPIDDVLAWADQLADALEYLHSQEPPVIHRDIKPSNLKVTPQGRLKLVDFGLVKQMIPDEMTITVIQGRGTALYTPLEQYGGDEGHTDARSDIYAFGATLYHLFTNTPPLEAKQRFLKPGSLQPPQAINTDLPNFIGDVILWAMRLHPDERPSTVKEFRESLFAKQPVFPISQTKPITDSIKEQLPERTDQWLFGAAALLILIALIATFT